MKCVFGKEQKWNFRENLQKYFFFQLLQKILEASENSWTFQNFLGASQNFSKLIITLKSCKIPGNFSLKFRLTWQKRSNGFVFSSNFFGSLFIDVNTIWWLKSRFTCLFHSFSNSLRNCNQGIGCTKIYYYTM